MIMRRNSKKQREYAQWKRKQFSGNTNDIVQLPEEPFTLYKKKKFGTDEIGKTFSILFVNS